MEFPTLTPTLLARHDRPGPRYTSYPTALEFTPDFGPEDHRRRLEALADTSDALSLYVHLPFCEKRCTFCACHVVVGATESLADRYLAAVSAEIATVARILGPGRRFAQLHWGGGTPTFHSPAVLAALHATITRYFEPDVSAEMAIEVDPRVTTAEHLEALVSLGFNRLSVGVQDIDAGVQDLIGRHQTRVETERLVDEARRAGFRSINLDLVYGLPGQSVDSFGRTLDAVLELRPERLAVYSFAYVPWMRTHQRRIDPASLPDRDTKFELLCQLVATLGAAGYVHIGMDHFAVASDELAIAAHERTLGRNFMGYTVARDADVVAFGTSAISELGGAHAQNHRRLADYLASALSGALPVERGRAPSGEDLLRRSVITDLMCHASVDLAAVAARFGVDPVVVFGSEIETLTRPGGLVDEGLATVTGLTVSATELGRFFVRRLAMVFDQYLNQHADAPRFSRTI
ncbi:MAG: oxygen-independent coproporphyrinogen III oxidase [Acidimicrobiia bacterium]